MPLILVVIAHRLSSLNTSSVSIPARVLLILANGATEEAFTAIAGDGVVVFAGGLVVADGTQLTCRGGVDLAGARRRVQV